MTSRTLDTKEFLRTVDNKQDQTLPQGHLASERGGHACRSRS